MSEKKTKIIIAGGGTGGHLFPGIAIAEEFLKTEGTEVLFVGVGNRLEKKVFDGLGLPYCTIRIEGVKGKGLKEAIKVLLKLPLSMKESYRIIRNFQPSLVMGVGGYVSGPVVLVAFLMGIKTAVAEQNAFPGLTNRILGKFADRIFLTYRESRKWFPTEKTLVTGNPVRAAFLSAGDIKKRADKFHILIFGGSQGARSINRIIASALPHLNVKEMGLSILHQTGNDDLQYMSDIYRRYELDAEVQPFIQDMASAYREADLVICRAGATSIAEITIMGKAAVLIPFPYAVDNHQKKNADALVKAGAAVMFEEKGLEGAVMAETIEHYCRHPHLLRHMGRKAASLGNVRAAADIVAASLALIKR